MNLITTQTSQRDKRTGEMTYHSITAFCRASRGNKTVKQTSNWFICNAMVF